MPGAAGLGGSTLPSPAHPPSRGKAPTAPLGPRGRQQRNPWGGQLNPKEGGPLPLFREVFCNTGAKENKTPLKFGAS